MTSNIDSIRTLIHALPTCSPDELRMVLTSLMTAFPTLIEMPDEDDIDALQNAISSTSCSLGEIIAVALNY